MSGPAVRTIAFSIPELAALYGCSPQTMRRRLKERGLVKLGRERVLLTELRGPWPDMWDTLAFTVSGSLPARPNGPQE